MQVSTTLEPDAKHELKLARQARSGVWRSGVVVVVVEIIGCGNHAEQRVRRERLWIRLSRVVIVVEGQVVRIAELDMIEDVKRLDAEFQGEPLGDARLLHESQIHLPGG